MPGKDQTLSEIVDLRMMNTSAGVIKAHQAAKTVATSCLLPVLQAAKPTMIQGTGTSQQGLCLQVSRMASDLTSQRMYMTVH